MKPRFDAALAWGVRLWRRMQCTIGWRLYAMLIPMAAGGILVGLEARAGLAGNAAGLIEARQIKELMIESRGHILVQDEASKTMVLYPEDTSAMKRKIEAYDANTALLKDVSKRVTDPEMQTLVRRLRVIAESRLAPVDTELSEAAAGGELAKASQIYRTRFLPARTDYDETVRQAALAAERLATAARAEMDRRNGASLHVIVITLASGIGAAGLGLLLLFRVAILRPLGEASQVIAAVAAGDFSRKTQQPAGHEIGRVVRAVNTMIDAVRESIQGITKSSRELTARAAALHGVSRSMDEGATRAATEAARISGAGKALMRSVQQSATLLGTLTSSITQVSSETQQAAGLAREAVARTQETRQSVERLAESGAVIDSITETMSRVAFETNILALNAAIEAARQGAAGRGFAVVAKQIRSMAEQTQQATTEISRRVEAVHIDIAAAVSGIGAIDLSNLKLAAIAASIAAETQRQGDVSRNLENEAIAMSDSTIEVSEHLDKVAGVIEQTRTGANQTRSDADAVAASARELDSLVAHFRL